MTDASADRQGIHLFILVGLETVNRARDAAHTPILSRKQNFARTSHPHRQVQCPNFAHSGDKPTEAPIPKDRS
ncbi:hypothetical protein MIC448_1110044 [Microbacterium sp. C448]|nr:hypothetical protein MIC448_1110044 [Microbacterium sp. C448]